MRRIIITGLACGAMCLVGACSGESGDDAGTTTTPTATTPTDGAASAGSTTTQTPPASPASPAPPADALSSDASDAAKDAHATVAEAAGKLSEPVRGAMEEYIASLGDTVDLLEGVKNQLSAAAAIPQLTGLANTLNGYWKDLEALSPETKQLLTEQFDAQLKPLIEKFNEQISRLSSDPDFGEKIAELAKSIKLFQ